MKAFPEFASESRPFWAFIKFVSEKLGYTNRRTKLVSSFSPEEIAQLCYDVV